MILYWWHKNLFFGADLRTSGETWVASGARGWRAIRLPGWPMGVVRRRTKSARQGGTSALAGSGRRCHLVAGRWRLPQSVRLPRQPALTRRQFGPASVTGSRGRHHMWILTRLTLNAVLEGLRALGYLFSGIWQQKSPEDKGKQTNRVV